MTVHIVVPARLASTRLPNKPLADIGGKAMIVRVLEQCQKGGYEDVIAAVDDEHVYQVVVDAGFGAELCATIAQEAFTDLDAAPVRVAGADTPIPFSSSLEDAIYSAVPRLRPALEALLAF